MSDFQKSITFTIMSAEVESLRSAIRAIRDARSARQASVMNDCIDSAIALLPEATKPDHDKSRKEAFSDVLG